MPAVQRSGDANSAGGVAQSTIKTVLVNGRPVLVGSVRVSPHPPCNPKNPTHCFASTVPKSVSVLAEGQPIILTGFADTCGHPRAGGSPNVLIGR